MCGEELSWRHQDILDWNVVQLSQVARKEGTPISMLGKDYMLAIIIVNYDGE